MKITLSAEHTDIPGNLVSTVTYSIYNEPSLPELMQEIKTFLMAIGYHPNNIKEYIGDE